MPKIIENLKPRLLEEAKRQVMENGYGAMTIRSVAVQCGVGVGTVYNYFPSKEAMTASFMLDDWQQCIAAIRACEAKTSEPKPIAFEICKQLRLFASKYDALFRDSGAVAGFAGAFGSYHSILRGQLADPLEQFCEDRFSAEFAAEALLTWTMAGKAFEELYCLVEKIFK